MNERERALLVDALGSAISDGEQSLGQVPALLIRTLKEGIWQDFETRLGEAVHHDHFTDFVAAPPLRGLGADVPMLRRIVAGNTEALDLLDQELQRPAGNPTGHNQHNGGISMIHANSSRPKEKPDRSTQGLRWLRKNRPDLHVQVVAGQKTENEAMVEAGALHHRVAMPVDDVNALAAALRRNLDATQLEALKKLLSEVTA